MNEQLSDDELAYHRKVIATMKAAQATMHSWSAHLADKYKLGPRDAISEDGAVYREPA